MRFEEIKMYDCGYRVNTLPNKGGLCLYRFTNGLALPATEKQAKGFYRMYCKNKPFGRLTYRDAKYVDELMRQNGFVADFAYSTLPGWVTLNNTRELSIAILRSYMKWEKVRIKKILKKADTNHGQGTWFTDKAWGGQLFTIPKRHYQIVEVEEDTDYMTMLISEWVLTNRKNEIQRWML